MILLLHDAITERDALCQRHYDRRNHRTQPVYLNLVSGEGDAGLFASNYVDSRNAVHADIARTEAEDDFLSIRTNLNVANVRALLRRSLRRISNTAGFHRVNQRMKAGTNSISDQPDFYIYSCLGDEKVVRKLIRSSIIVAFRDGEVSLSQFQISWQYPEKYIFRG